MDLDPNKEIATNVQLLDRAVKAIENLSPNLKFVVLPTGTKVNKKESSREISTDTTRHTEFI